MRYLDGLQGKERAEEEISPSIRAELLGTVVGLPKDMRPLRWVRPGISRGVT